MDLLRALFEILLIWAGFYLLRRVLERPAPPAPKRQAMPGKMVRCARCGLHVPENEALHASGRHYCSEQHRRADKNK
ncbi:MAG: hypothetical protein KGJ12_06875 [Gammaproteobacteria bacterium]|nr:hypothetical protein [Gammaproteobacteria bacterium]